MGLGDALDDGQAEAETRMVTADAFGAPLERFGERRDQLWRERVAGVLHGERDGLGAGGGGDLHGAVLGEVVDDGVVHQVRGQLEQQRVGADGGGDVPGRLDGHAVLLGEGEERLGGLLRDQGQVDGFPGERSLIGAAEQEQGLGEVDRPGVDRVEPLDEDVRRPDPGRCGRRRAASG